MALRVRVNVIRVRAAWWWSKARWSPCLRSVDLSLFKSISPLRGSPMSGMTSEWGGARRGGRMLLRCRRREKRGLFRHVEGCGGGVEQGVVVGSIGECS